MMSVSKELRNGLGMSVVTTIMVSASSLDELQNPEVVECLETFHPDQGGLLKLAGCHRDSPRGLWGGGKGPQCSLWAGAFNHLDTAKAVRRLEALPWKYPQFVQVFVKLEDDWTFRVMMFRQGRLAEIVPPMPWPDGAELS